MKIIVTGRDRFKIAMIGSGLKWSGCRVTELELPGVTSGLPVKPDEKTEAFLFVTKINEEWDAASQERLENDLEICAEIARLRNINSLIVLQEVAYYSDTRLVERGIQDQLRLTSKVAAGLDIQVVQAIKVVPKPAGAFSRLFSSLRAAVQGSIDADKLAREVIVAIEEKHTFRFISERQEGNWFYHVAMRLLDVLAALAVLLFFWWFLLVVWCLIKLTSKGPGIFVQDRIGKNGKTFRCFKFRTMHTDTRIAGTHEISAASVTAVGRIIRRLKIDELPQAWNILLGQMTLVGPRPSLVVQQDLIAARQKLGVLDFKCGLTGLSQINAVDMSDPEKLANSDAEYLARRSILMNLKILILTFLGSGRRDGIKSS